MAIPHECRDAATPYLASREVRNALRQSLIRRHDRKEKRVPYGTWINNLPTWFFMVVHIAAFAVAVYFAWVAVDRDAPLLATGFGLYALAEVSYMTYHLDWTVFLFAHTISEVLDLGAFVCVFAGAVLRVRAVGRREQVALEAS
jgi:predicted hotdog family 3-hydroxylacyl-ACP dehydratase